MRIYGTSVIRANNEKTKEVFSKLYDMENGAEEKFGIDNLPSFNRYSHDFIRQVFDLPNKVFALAKNKEEVVIVLFDKEPGANYKVYIDDETHQPFIEVDENEVE